MSPTARRARRVAVGIYQDQYGYRVVWPLLGKAKCRRFPLDAPIERLKAYRRQQVNLAAQRRGLDRTGSFVRDVVRFLRLRRGRPSFKSDRAHLRPWCKRFLHKSRWAIASEDCALAIADWREVGYSAREIRHRVRLLRELYRALDGVALPTPLDELELPKVPKSRPRSVPDTLVRDVALELRKHEVLGYLRNAKTRARYLVDATCGQRPVQHMRAQPADVDLERRIWFVDGAKHDNGAIVYLNDDMVAAWSLFIAAKAWGRYDRRSYAKTLRRCGWPQGVRPYVLRHTVGLSLSEVGVDLGDIQAHMGHSNINTTRQFYVPAVLSRLKDASDRIDGRLMLTRGAGTIAVATVQPARGDEDNTRDSAAAGDRRAV
jgi:integrase